MELNIEEILKSFIDLERLSSKLQKENEMRKEMKCCDLTIKINDKDEFKVHRTIIASSCQYFNGMLSGDWKESSEDIISLDYKIIPECFEIILEYLYTGKLGITKISFEYAKIIHEAAVYFNLLTLKNVMSRILENFISDENILELWRHGVKFFDKNLQEKLFEHIAKQFFIFVKQNLQELKFSELKSLYANTSYWSLEDFCETLIEWVTFDFGLREKYLKDLFDLIDFSKVSGKFIQSKILNVEKLNQNKDFLNKIMRELSNGYNIRLQTKIAENKFEKLGILLISNTGIFKIDLEEKKCLPLLNHKINRENFTVNKFGLNNILISGGLNSNICEYYSPHLNLIREFPPMLEKRWRHKVLPFDNKIYAFGGFDNDTMEIFDINIGKWNYGQKMPTTFCDFALIEYEGVFGLLNIFVDANDVARAEFDIKNGYWQINPNPNFEITKAVVKKFACYDSDAFIRYNSYIPFNTKYVLRGLHDIPTLSTAAAVMFTKEIFVFGKGNSKKFYSAMVDPLTMISRRIQIDLSSCNDIGNEFHLITAYL